MSLNLSDHESGAKYGGDYEADLAALQERLARILVGHIVHRRRSLILFEGWDAAGKGGAIQRLTAQWDPRAFGVWPIAAPTAEEKARHFLWRFWTKLPAAGQIAVFDRSWYGRVLVERVEAFAKPAEWRRAYDEINDFEKQQIDDGTAIVKLFFHVTPEVQDQRLRARLEHPWKRWKVSAEDFRNRARRPEYVDATHDMLARTNSAQAPWTVIDGNNKKSARISALTAIVDALEPGLPSAPPPASAEIEAIAAAAWKKEG
jgi:polyphosphate kinase 2 (PPK2 family)